MAFRARRLRVQLPCGEPTLVDVGADRGEGAPPLSEPACAWIFASAPPCGPLSCLEGPCDPPFASARPQGDDVQFKEVAGCPAGFITPDIHCRGGHISLPTCPNTLFPPEKLVMEVEAGRFLADPAALPLLKRHLQTRLHEIEVAQREREHVEARLRDVERAEQQLREQDDEG